MPSWSVIEAYEAGYEQGQRDGRQRRVAADIKQQQGFRSLPAGHTAQIIDWAAVRRARGLPAEGTHYNRSDRRERR